MLAKVIPIRDFDKPPKLRVVPDRDAEIVMFPGALSKAALKLDDSALVPVDYPTDVA